MSYHCILLCIFNNEVIKPTIEARDVAHLTMILDTQYRDYILQEIKQYEK